MDQLYYRLCKTLEDIGEFYPIEDNVYDHIDNFELDWYQSVYYYIKDQVDEARKIITCENKYGKTYKRIRGVGRVTDSETGMQYQTIENVVTNKLIFDFDSINDIEEARRDALELIDTLVEEYDIHEEAIQICFSGNKGYSLVVEFNDFLKVDDVRNICMILTEGLRTRDSRIYNPARIFRLPLTKHQDSQLYKIPLTSEDLMDYISDEIKESAKVRPSLDAIQDAWEIIELPEKIYEVKKLSRELILKKTYSPEIVSAIESIDFSVLKNFPYLTPSKFVLQCGQFQPGQRHDAFMILASCYKNAGYTRGDAYQLLQSVDEKHCKIHHRTDKFSLQELWDNILESVYSDGWHGGTFGPDHPILQEIDQNLPAYLKDKKKQKLVGNESIFDKFKKFAIDIDKNTLRFGIKSLDKILKILTGTSIGILGVPGVGKSSLALNLLNANSKAGEPSIFFSLDMNEALIALKQIQRNTGLSNDEIFNLVKTDLPRFKELQQKAIAEFENVEYSFRFGITPADIREDIMEYEARTGKKLRLVVVDYLENVQSGYTDPTIGSGAVAQQLTNIANELDVAMVILLQTQKSKNPEEPIESMRSIKGASVIEQGLSCAIGIHREGQLLKHQDYDNTMTINVLKNRFGPLSSTIVSWKGARSLLMDLTEEDRLRYTELMEIKQQEKEENKNDKGNWD